MKHLKAAGLLAGLTLVASAAQAQTPAQTAAPAPAPQRFYFVGADAGGASMIDRDSIRKTGDTAAFDVVIVYRSPVPLDVSAQGGGYPRFAHYLVGKREIDCAGNRYREVSGQVFDFAAQPLAPTNDAGTWAPLMEGDATIASLVCRGQLPADAQTIDTIANFATAYYAELFQDAAQQSSGAAQ